MAALAPERHADDRRRARKRRRLAAAALRAAGAILLLGVCRTGPLYAQSPPRLLPTNRSENERAREIGTPEAETAAENDGRQDDAAPRSRESPATVRPSRLITPDDASGEDRGAGRRGAATGSFWTTLGALSLVVGLILVVAKLWRKHGPRISGALPGEAVEILGKRHIDGRQTVYLLRLGSRLLVLGSTSASLSTLAEITDPVEVDYLAGLCRRKEAGGQIADGFRTLFRRQQADGSAETGSSHAGSAATAKPADAFSTRMASAQGRNAEGTHV